MKKLAALAAALVLLGVASAPAAGRVAANHHPVERLRAIDAL
jgi:hypothetical protein